MKIISHRGYWLLPHEKNSEEAFERSFSLGFGTETDVRDREGQLVIAHDMAKASDISFDRFLEIYGNCGLPLAINIKSDGLAFSLQEALSAHSVKNYFVFDCAIPDLREHIRCGNAVYTRMSEVEVVPAWLKHAQGVWLDGFDGDWCRALDIEDLLAREKGVCVVSPELHGRDPAPYWEMLKPLSEHPRLMLCTDHPVKARSFFDTSIIGRGQQ